MIAFAGGTPGRSRIRIGCFSSFDRSLPRLVDVPSSVADRRVMLVIGWTRILVAVAVVGVLLLTFAGRVAVGDDNPFDYFGYFTNQTSLLTSGVLIATGALMVSGRPVPRWLTSARAVAVACLIVVAAVYNVLVPGTGSAPAWVSAILHVFFPLFVLVDWLIVGDRRPVPWGTLWIVLPYPLAWLTVVLIRGATDGWVPYGFLLPERGAVSPAVHSIGILLALVVAGAVAWAGSRAPGVVLRAVPTRD